MIDAYPSGASETLRTSRINRFFRTLPGRNQARNLGEEADFAPPSSSLPPVAVSIAKCQNVAQSSRRVSRRALGALNLLLSLPLLDFPVTSFPPFCSLHLLATIRSNAEFLLPSSFPSLFFFLRLSGKYSSFFLFVCSLPLA